MVRKLVDRGAVAVAEKLGRREFLRKASLGVFYGVAVLTTGKLGEAPAFARPPYTMACAGTPGPGCPSNARSGLPCGPSRCCAAASKPACNCSNGITCKKNSSTPGCRGRGKTTWSGTSCWTCQGPVFTKNGCKYRWVTTCCDCTTVGCGDPRSRCVGWHRKLVMVGGKNCAYVPG